ncbi:MAG: HEAT repeat domain-containing protein [FCB group bacterium]|nr:HEAT repeat domain-containing protein [FCB group bacterium]
MMKTLKINCLLYVLIVLCLFSTLTFAEDSLKSKIDSMFLIASSGDFKFRDLVQPTMDDIAAIGVEAAPYLIDRLGTEDARERVTLRQIFQKIGTPAVPLLNDALLETDSLQLSRVALILYYLPDGSSVDNLMKVSDKEYYWARYQVMRALGKIGDMKARPTIEKALQDSIELVRTMAAVAAGRIDAVTFFPELVNALSDNYYGVRMAAIEELKKLDCPAKLKLLPLAMSAAETEIPRNLLLSIMASDSCVYDLQTLRPLLESSDPVTQSLALRTMAKGEGMKIINEFAESFTAFDNLLLQQTIKELTESYETKKTLTNP